MNEGNDRYRQSDNSDAQRNPGTDFAVEVSYSATLGVKAKTFPKVGNYKKGASLILKDIDKTQIGKTVWVHVIGDG